MPSETFLRSGLTGGDYATGQTQRLAFLLPDSHVRHGEMGGQGLTAGPLLADPDKAGIKHVLGNPDFTLAELGATLGFVGAFFRSSVTKPSKKD